MKTQPEFQGVIALCRAGFEKDLLQELMAHPEVRTLGVHPGRQGTAWVSADCFEADRWQPEMLAQGGNRTVFARLLLPWLARLEQLPASRRAEPIVAEARALGLQVDDVQLGYPDADATNMLSGFCRRFDAPLRQALREAGVLRKKPSPQQLTLYLLFTAADTVWLCLALPQQLPKWPLGIARLRYPKAAASRSTLKLAEAFQVLLDDDERQRLLRPGLAAVDLGAAPGGWSWQLASRGLRVTAVDNGPMASSVLATGLVEHLKQDGFRWRSHQRVEWLVCDMVEQPSRVAALAADWVAEKRCRRAMFNLKLPMKKRLDAITDCRKRIRDRLAPVGDFDLRIRHLYHDREEVTVYLCLNQ